MTISPNSSSPKGKISKDKYSIIDVKGDGNCMFRAIALGMKKANDEKKAKSHSTIRQIATKWIEDNIEWSEVRQIQTATDGRRFKTKTAYLKYIKNEGIWGGSLELEALSSALKVNICVIYDSTMEQTCFGRGKKITLFYLNNEHYQLAIKE
jgi:phosphoserine aminotransferase